MKLTIAIPTIAGRSRYLAATLRTCVSQDVDNVEFLVSDNPGPDAQDVVEALRDPRVRYVRPPSYLPMAAHWDFVLGEATGDTLCIIGDDDGLMPGCLQTVNELRRRFGDVPIHHSLGNYYWPDSPNVASRNQFRFFHALFDEPRWVESRAFLRELAGARSRYLDGPMVYHNFIPIHALRDVARDGVYFLRSSPDVYSAVAVAAGCERFLSVGRLLTIAGQGARSTGALVRIPGEAGEQFFAQARSPRYAPRFAARTVQLHVLDTVLEVARQFGRADIVAEVDWVEHLRWAIAETLEMADSGFRRDEAREILRIARSQGVLLPLAAALARTAARRLDPRRHARRQVDEIAPGYQMQLAGGVTDVSQAVLSLDATLRKRERG